MIIYADIRPLIVTGIVLLFTNFGWNYPLPLKRKLQIPGKRMIMTKKSCQDPIGNKGICMFKYDCIRQKGVTLSTCVDGFLFGACCFLKEDPIQIIADDIHSEPTHLVDYKEPNATIYNFYQIESDASLNNSTEYFRPLQEIFNTSFSNFSNENSSTNLLDLFQSTTIDLSDVNNFTIFKSVLNKYIYNNTTKVPLTAAIFSKSSASESINFFTLPIDYDEESVIKNKSSSLGALFQNSIGINKTNDLPASVSPTETHPVPAFESSDEIQLEEYRNQFTSTNHFDYSSVEKNTTDINNYFNEGKENENENSTAMNIHIFSDLNSTDSSETVHEHLQQNISVSTEKYYELNGTEELTNDNLPLGYYNISIQSSESTDSTSVSSIEINFSTISENEPTEFYDSTKISEYENSITSDKNFITGSTQNTIVLTTFETPSIQANSELNNLELTSTAASVSHDHPKLNEFEKKELLNANVTSSHFTDFENITLYDKPVKLYNDSWANFNKKSSNSNMTSDDKKTTKAVLLPTLPWSSNSILPESFQSVISQLIEQEVSSPGNFILDHETLATPAVDVNMLVDQNLLLDSEESIRLEFKSHNISGYLDDEYDKNIVLSELFQTSNTELDEADNFTSTSSIGFNDNKFDDRNKNSLLIPNVLSQDLTTNELNVKLTENINTDVSSQDNSDITSDEYYTKEISQTVEDIINASEGKKTELSTSVSSQDILTEQNNQHTKLLESNLNSFRDEVLLSTQTESYTFTTTAFQDSNNQKEPNMHLSSLLQLDQNFSEPSTSSSNVQIQLLDNLLYNVTEVSATLTEETTMNSYPTVIQIINNHTGKNSSAINFSNHIKDANVSYVSTVFVQSEETEAKEVSTTVYPIVNISLENSSNLYETEAFVNTSTPMILNVEDFEESHQFDSSIHPVVNTDTSDSFNESLDSSQSTSFEIISSYTDFNSTNMLPSILIDNSTSPFTTIAHYGTKDTQLHSTDFEVHDLIPTVGQSFESIGDSYNLNITEDEHSTTPGNYSDGSSNPITTGTESTNNMSLNYSDESSSDDSFGLHITTELGYAETSVFTTSNAEISETVSSHVLTTLSDAYTWADLENLTLPVSSKPTDLNASDKSITTSFVETIPTSTSTNAAITQNLNFLTQGDAFSNTSHEYSVVHSTGNTTLSTMLPSESFSIQDYETTNVDKLTSLSTLTYSTPVRTTTMVPKVDIPRWNYKKDCGVRLMQPVGRIVGGKNTYFGKWPWQALVKEATWLGLFVKNKCGGVLITSKYVLTAAHCQPGFLASLLVVLGTHDLAETFDNKASIIRNVKRMVVHRHYNAQTFENDLALLEMEAPVEFLPYVVPICLPHRNEDFTGKMAFVTGWGKLTAGGDVPNILQEVQVPIVSNGECQSMFYQAGHHKAIRSNFVCAGYINGGQDSCEGDSGGPLMVQREDTRWVLVGTVSHGIGCADPNLPGVYMRMSSYRPWIDSIIYK